MRCTTTVALALFGCLALSAANAGELYKWTDAQGRTHYTDKPPPEGQGEVERRDVPEEPDSAIKTAAAPESPECQLARKNLKLFQTSPVILMDIDGDGENERLEGEQLQRYAERAKQQMATYCITKPAEREPEAEQQR